MFLCGKIQWKKKIFFNVVDERGNPPKLEIVHPQLGNFWKTVNVNQRHHNPLKTQWILSFGKPTKT